MIKIDNVKKQYRLGAIGGGTLTADLQSWWARIHGREDPNSKIGSKIYQKNEKFMALDGVCFSVNKGERVGIIGHNGAGKSTLLKLLSRVTAPTEGKICLNGRIASMLEVGTGFHGELTGRENIYMNGAILGMNREEIDSKIDKIIEFSECAQFIDTPVKRYSSGMYVKLAFSVAAHLDSEIMIMDEVLAVGDINFQQKCLKKMKSVAEEEGRTILYVSHNMSTIRELCSRCIVLSHGKLIYDGDVETAISIYQQNGFDEGETDFYFDGTTKHSDQKMKCYISHIHNETPYLEMEDSLVFRMHIVAQDDIPSAILRIIIRTQSDIRAGMTYTDIFSLHKGENDIRFCFDATELAPGRYMIDPILIEYQNNMQVKHHATGCTMPFTVEETEHIYNSPWMNGWGNVRFKSVKVEKECI